MPVRYVDLSRCPAAFDRALDRQHFAVLPKDFESAGRPSGRNRVCAGPERPGMGTTTQYSPRAWPFARRAINKSGPGRATARHPGLPGLPRPGRHHIIGSRRDFSRPSPVGRKETSE
ncbi:hypothetical protein GCM10022243_19660 [Saccharothrix violaceirubra]